MLKLYFPEVTKEYRPELNGLRGIAVLLVLLFHIDIDWMQGGFLGVDVFLVISGYFISRNIIYELQQGKFTFYNFYTRRLRRLFPALIVTLTLVLIVGFFFLAPADYERLGKSTFFSTLSLSNFFFMGEAGYFDVDSITKPLLHMWSLSLEEQFYLFWPLLLFTLYKFFRKHIMIFIIILIGTSIFICEYYYATNPKAVFFMIPFRMFEFMLGASCIWLEKYSFKTPNLIQEFLFSLGLVLIGYSAIVFDAYSKMPGFLSLIPCIGSMLIIFSGKNLFSCWTLKNKPMELIGKASYSIYLIHWPLVIYYKYFTLNELTIVNQLALVLASIFLGFLMWYFIENTFRYVKNKGAKVDKVWVGVPASILLLILLSTNVWGSDGYPDRFKGELYMTKEEILSNRKSYWKESNSKNGLLKGVPGKGHSIIFGNSHAIDIIYALRQNGFEAKITSLQTAGKCYNFGSPIKEIDTEYCLNKRKQNLNNSNWNLADVIYLHDHWPKFDTVGLRVILDTIRDLSSAPIYVFGPKMTYKEQVPDIIRVSNSFKPNIINERAKKYSNKDIKVDINRKLLEEFKKPYYYNNNIIYIDILTLQGGKNYDNFEVVSEAGLKFLYFDAQHLTKQGSKELGKKIKEKHPFLFSIKKISKEQD